METKIDLTDAQKVTLTALLYIFIGIYSLCFLFTLYNIWALIRKNRRYTQHLITIFYVLSIVVFVTRILDMIGLTWLYRAIKEDSHKVCSHIFIGVTSTISDYAIVLIGFN